MIKYFQIMKSGLSYELDSDIHYYHHFKIGELLVCEFGDDEIKERWGVIYKRVITYDEHNVVILNRRTYQGNKEFTINWDSINSEKKDLVELIKGEYLFDITKNIHRERKLELIGI